MTGSLLQCSYVSFGSEMPQTASAAARKSTHEHMGRIVPESVCRDINVAKDRAVNPEWICAGLFDHLVGARTAARPCRALLGLEVDHQLGLRRLLNGQVHP